MSSSVSIVSQSIVAPDSKSSSPLEALRLSASDLQMLKMNYIQNGCLFPGKPPNSLSDDLKTSLSKAISIFRPLAGRLSTDSATGHISIECSDAGALFVHARASSLRLNDVFGSSCTGDVPAVYSEFFALNDTISFDGDSNPIVAVQVTELVDSFFIGCSINHAVVDGLSFWHFFSTFAETCKASGPSLLSPPPCFSRRDSVFYSDIAVRFPGGRPVVNPTPNEPLRERIFHFSRRSVLEMKQKANESFKLMTTQNNNNNNNNTNTMISSMQSVSAQLWRSVTRARKLAATRATSFSLVVNCRDRAKPKMDPWYFGNAIQSIQAVATAGEVVTQELGWSAHLLHRGVVAHDDETVKKKVEDWEKEPRFPAPRNMGDAWLSIGCSPRFPMYDIDFGWGRPVAVRSGKANKCDGRFSAYPGRDGDGSIDMEVVLKEATMVALENDPEFLYYINLT